ncbi:hypothetical protein JXA63_02010 [Candidatus Woesebacteria bacterium]|nr:hypothetical protein [Candidatus Woesebacteria bacterium]
MESPEQLDTTWHEGEPLDWDNICFVRALVNPKNQLINKNRKLVSQTAIDSSKGEIPRITQHWTINHFVTQHYSNSWVESGAVLLCPGKNLVESNGKPESLYAVDTFWSHDMEIPEGSMIIWLSEKPQDIEIPKGVKSVDIRLPKKTYEELNKAQKKLEERDFSSTEELYRLESDKFRLKEDLQAEISKHVENHLKRMGYPAFWGNNGQYMVQGGVDEAVAKLRKREDIKYTGKHVNTLFGYLELGDGWFLAPLMELGTQSDEDLLKTNEEGMTRFEEIINYVSAHTRYFHEPYTKFPYSKGEIKQFNVFSAELYNRLINLEGVMDSEIVRESLKNICDNNTVIKGNLKDWFVKFADQKEKNQKLLDIIEGSN